MVEDMFITQKTLGLIPSTKEQTSQTNKKCIKHFVNKLEKHSDIKLRIQKSGVIIVVNPSSSGSS